MGPGLVLAGAGRARLTSRGSPQPPGPVHLHALGVHTPALLPPHVALHRRVRPRILTLRQVGCGGAVDVAAQQDLLLLQLAERQTWGSKEPRQSRWGGGAHNAGGLAQGPRALSLEAGRQGRPSQSPGMLKSGQQPQDQRSDCPTPHPRTSGIVQTEPGRGRSHPAPLVRVTPHSHCATEMGVNGVQAGC